MLNMFEEIVGGNLKCPLTHILTQEVEPRGAEKDAGDDLVGAANLYY